MQRELAALAIMLALVCLGASTAWAQAHTYLMVTPGELTWTAVPALPAGAQLAVIEGPLNEAAPFTIRTGRPLAQLLGYPQAWLDAGRARPRMVLLSIGETRGNVPLQVVEAVPWGIQEGFS